MPCVKAHVFQMDCTLSIIKWQLKWPLQTFQFVYKRKKK